MTDTIRWSLRMRVSALCAAAAVLLGLLGAAAAVVAATNRSHLDVILNKTGPMRTAGERLMVALVNQQTGMRGYLLSGKEGELAPYLTGRDDESGLYASLEPLVQDQPAIRAQLEQVRTSAQQWRENVAEPAIAELRRQGVEPAQKLLNEIAGDRFASVRAEISKLQDAILALRNDAVTRVKDTSNILIVLLICAAAVVLVAGLALMVLLHRLITRPVLELAEQVRAVAAGSYDQEIVGAGPPELIALARDVESMRRRIVADLAEVRRARESVEEINARLELQAAELTRSNRDLEQFAYVASHDLQEPLRKVGSFCQLLQRRYSGQLDERADQYIEFAVDGAQRMQRLINDLLEFSRIGRSTSEFAAVSLSDLMAEVNAQLEPTRNHSGGEITWSGLPVVRGEEVLIGTLLANLAGNSLKFGRPGVPPKVDVSAIEVDEGWEITFSDNGIGIEEEFTDKVFVIFQRLHAKDAYPGTGIGLAIAKKIVEYHGGSIWVHPHEGEGAMIKFTLPRENVE